MTQIDTSVQGAETPNEATLTIDGKEYKIDQLSEEALGQINNVRATDQEIARIQQQLAIVQTARMAYYAALQQALPKAPVA